VTVVQDRLPPDRATTTLLDLTRDLQAQEETIRQGTGEVGRRRQEQLGRLTVRKRLSELLDEGSPFWELGLWAAWKLYRDWGDVPAAGVVTGIGQVSGRRVLVVANDATVKAGAFFPQTVKKVLRAQRIATAFRLPLVYLVDSAGVFLPLQDEIFPDEDDFGRIFRNNAVISAMGIPQYAAVMGNCVAGGAYLPVLSDTLLITEGSQLYLAGPALVKAAIGQRTDPEELGGAAMHARISGTADYHEPDDHACLRRLRSLVGLLPAAPGCDEGTRVGCDVGRIANPSSPGTDLLDGLAIRPTGTPTPAPARNPEDLYRIVPADGRGEYDVRDVLACLADAGSVQEFRADFGRTLVTAFVRIGGRPAGMVASQRKRCRTAAGEVQIGGVLYADSAEKAARFVMECNQTSLPLVFLQDVQGFMVGREAEQSGIIRSGAKLVNVVSNSVVPKLTVILGGSFGAGNYALCGKAYDPWLVLAWPSARYAVMGGEQAADTLLELRLRDARRREPQLADDEIHRLREEMRRQYEEQTDIRYGAARGWVDAIVAPSQTRQWLAMALGMIPEKRTWGEFRTGMLQV
jgi:acetyl-CoA carboxylase carboxyltransferase component